VTGLINASSGYVYSRAASWRRAGTRRHGVPNPTMLPWLTLLDNVMLPLKSCRRSGRKSAPSASEFATG